MGRKIKRGVKIYRQNRRRSTLRKVVTTILTIVIVAVLAVVGYSIGKPVMEFLKNQDSSLSDISSWVPSTTTPSSSAPSSQDSSTSSTLPAVSDGSIALELPASLLQDKAALATALQEAKAQGYTAAVLRLKDDTGKLLYDSKVEAALTAATPTVPLADIAAAITEAQLTPIARINTLNDHLAPAINKGLSYKFNGSDSNWFDNTVEKGGKPWLSPFADATRAYLADITREIAAAGFKQIIYAGVAFPPFRNSDLNYIGDLVKSPTRWTALTAVVNDGAQAAKEQGADVLPEVSAKGIIEQTAEVFHTEELKDKTVVAIYNRTEVGASFKEGEIETVVPADNLYEAVKLIYTKAAEKAAGVTLLPCIERGDMDAAALGEAVRALTDLGYKSYLVR